MKRRCVMLGLMVLLTLAVLVALAVPAGAAPAKDYFTSTWVQTGLSWYPYPHDSGQGNVWHLVDFEGTHLVFSADSNIAGSALIYGDARVLIKDSVMLQAEWTGKFTLRPTSDPSSIWTGSFTLKNDVTGASTLWAQAIGKAGAVTGWVMKFSGHADYGQPLTVTGYYMEK